MAPHLSGLKLALKIALDGADVDQWLAQRTDDGNSLRTIAAEVSDLLGQTVSHHAVSKWLSAEAAA